MGIEALYRKPKTSGRHSEYKIHPYLLRDKVKIRVAGLLLMNLSML